MSANKKQGASIYDVPGIEVDLAAAQEMFRTCRGQGKLAQC